MNARRRAVLLALLAVPGCAASPSAHATSGRIAFYSDRDGNPEIYVMDADGGAPTRVTRHPAFDVAPALSPDGSRDRPRVDPRW